MRTTLRRTSPITMPADIVEDALAHVASFVRRRVERQRRVGRERRLDREQHLPGLDEKPRPRAGIVPEMVVDPIGQVALVGPEPRADMCLGLVGHARHRHDDRGNQPRGDLQGEGVLV